MLNECGCGEVGQDGTHLSCSPCFFCFGRGSGKAGLKHHDGTASLFPGEETEVLKWGVTMLDEAGSPEKVKERMVEVP